MPRGISGSGTITQQARSGTQTVARAGRARSPTASVSKTVPATTGKAMTGQPLFYGADWIALPANNQYGFVLFNISSGEPMPIMQDAGMILQAFAWHLRQDGLLKLKGGTVTGAAVARTRTTGNANGQRRTRSVPISRVAVGAGSQTGNN